MSLNETILARGSSRAPATGKVIVLMLAGLAGLGFAALTFGVKTTSAGDLLAVLRGEAAPDIAQVTQLRWHRFVTGVVVGIFLAISGATLQAVLRNPLAEPGVIGLNSGAALAATGLLLFASGNVPSYALSLAAIAGAFIAVVLVATLSWSRGASEPIKLILAGIALSALSGALLTAGMLVGPPQRLPRLMFWLSGDLNGAGAREAYMLMTALLCALPLAWLVTRKLDVAMLDRLTAGGLGNRGVWQTWALLGFAAGLAGIATAAAGIIVFVGLIAPHLARSLVGPVNWRVVPVAGLIGALLITGADLLGRLVDPPNQIPAGLVCGLVGAPVFFVIMRRQHG